MIELIFHGGTQTVSSVLKNFLFFKCLRIISVLKKINQCCGEIHRGKFQRELLGMVFVEAKI